VLDVREERKGRDYTRQSTLAKDVGDVTSRHSEERA
jgi:hypothetical protein